MCHAAKNIADTGLDAHQLIYYHDEFDFECPPHQAIQLSALLEDSIAAASLFYRMNVPLKGESKIGNNWKEIH
jgi:DNA polymerase I-like protein with 3'-5' exonuclease and polymerase domains